MSKLWKNGQYINGIPMTDKTLDTASENPIANKAVAEAVGTINSNLSSLVEIRTKTVSGTTSGFGLANLGLTDYDVITKVKMTSPSANATFIKHSWNDNHDYCLVNVASTSLAKLVNTAFSGTITYLHFTPINS